MKSSSSLQESETHGKRKKKSVRQPLLLPAQEQGPRGDTRARHVLAASLDLGLRGAGGPGPRAGDVKADAGIQAQNARGQEGFGHLAACGRVRGRVPAFPSISQHSSVLTQAQESVPCREKPPSQCRAHTCFLHRKTQGEEQATHQRRVWWRPWRRAVGGTKRRPARRGADVGGQREAPAGASFLPAARPRHWRRAALFAGERNPTTGSLTKVRPT